jgi:ABC-2 type transport system permease protein
VLNRTRLLAVARKEVLHIRRDKRSLLLAFVVPVLLLVLFGYAITWDVRDIATAVLDRDGSSRSRELVDAFRASGYFRITTTLEREADVDRLMDAGQVRVALVVPVGFARDLDAGRQAPVQVIVDGSDANTATIALGYARGVVQSFSERVLLRDTVAAPPVETRTRIWYNEELVSRNMIVPGLVAVIMMIIAAMLSSLTIAREWERGTMEQLASTPVTRTEVVLGKLLPYAVIGFADVVLVSVTGVILFGVPFRGSAPLLAALSLAFLTGALGLGIFISAVARSQLLATQMAMIFTFLPGFLLSGFMFSVNALPQPLRAITYLVPARYFLVVTRGVFLKGVGVEALWTQGLFMIAFAAAGIAAATRVFRKEIA